MNTANKDTHAHDRGREVVYWDCGEDAEILEHTTIGGAAEAYIERLFDGAEPDVLPRTIRVFGWARMVCEPKDFGDEDYLVEMALESADEHYGAPEDPTEPTPEMLRAARAFLAAMQRAYTTRACEVVAVRTIDLEAWIRASGVEYGGQFVDAEITGAPCER